MGPRRDAEREQDKLQKRARRNHDPEARALEQETAREQRRDPVAGERIRARDRARRQDPAVGEHLREEERARRQDPVVRERTREQRRVRRSNPETGDPIREREQARSQSQRDEAPEYTPGPLTNYPTVEDLAQFETVSLTQNYAEELLLTIGFNQNPMSALAMFHASSSVDLFEPMMRHGVDVTDSHTRQHIVDLIREATPTNNDIEHCLTSFKVLG